MRTQDVLRISGLRLPKRESSGERHPPLDYVPIAGVARSPSSDGTPTTKAQEAFNHAAEILFQYT